MANAKTEKESIIQYLFSVNLKILLTTSCKLGHTCYSCSLGGQTKAETVPGVLLDQQWLNYFYAECEITDSHNPGKSDSYITLLIK